MTPPKSRGRDQLQPFPAMNWLSSQGSTGTLCLSLGILEDNQESSITRMPLWIGPGRTPVQVHPLLQRPWTSMRLSPFPLSLAHSNLGPELGSWPHESPRLFEETNASVLTYVGKEVQQDSLRPPPLSSWTSCMSPALHYPRYACSTLSLSLTFWLFSFLLFFFFV